MLLVSNVRSLREENEVSKTIGKRQPLREAKNTANTRIMVENALSEPDDNSDSDTGEESNLFEEGNKTKTSNEPIKLGIQKYECPFCSKILPHAGNMKKHILTHTGEKPYTCNECGKAFSLKSNLTKHTLIHTGEKPFSCEFCDYSSIFKADVKRHVKRVHNKIQ